MRVMPTLSLRSSHLMAAARFCGRLPTAHPPSPSLFAPVVAVENLASPLKAQQHDEKRTERIHQAEAKHKSTPGVEEQKSEEVRVCIYGSPFHVTLK